MIELSIANHEVSYNIEISPPLLELAEIGHRSHCIKELCTYFDLAIRDILFGKEPASYQFYFTKEYQGTSSIPETFSATIGFDSINTNSRNFKSLERTVEKHMKVLDVVLEKADFSPKIQTLSYQANANVEHNRLNDYLEQMIAFRPKLPGELRNRALILDFDGPTKSSTVQIIIGGSQNITDGLFLSIQFFFRGKDTNYKQLFKLCEEFSKNEIFPALGIKIKEPSDVE